MRLALALAAALLAAPASAAGPAHAGFPGFDAARERVVFGGVPAGPATPVPSGMTLGTWSDDHNALALAVRPPGRDAVWLAADAVGDGLVRLRVELDGKVDFGLALRATPSDPELELAAGYTVSLAGDHARLDRWDRGLALPISPAVRVPGLGGKLRRVEVVALLLGPQISVQIYDGGSLHLLASLSARDTSYASGRVGLRAGPKQATEHRFTLLSSMSLGAGPSGPVPQAIPGPYGGLRWFYVDPTHIDALPPDLRGKLQKAPVDGLASASALLLGPADAERLRRSGARIVAERGDLPWGATDPEYRARRDRPPEETATGLRIDASFKDPPMVEALLRGWARKFPALARVHELGRTRQGRPLLALKISDNPDADEDEPTVLLNGAHHGSELMAIEYALDAAQQLVENYRADAHVRRWVDGLEIWVVPLVNPDGNHQYMNLSRGAGRKNGRDNDGDGRFDLWDGVDLNRNYPFQWGALGEAGSRSWYADGRYRGPAPASEPEVAAIMKLAADRRFAASISFHTYATAVLSPYTIDGVANPRADEAWPLAERLAGAAPKQPNGRNYVVKRQLYAVDGTDQDWHRHAFGTLAFLVEGSNHNPREPEIRAAAIRDTRPVWATLLDAMLDGPAISGHVRDDTGAPVEVEVVVEEVQPQQGERWTSRPRDGRFDRSVPAAGRYTVRAAAPEGCPPVRRTLDVRRRERVDLVVPARPCTASR